MFFQIISDLSTLRELLTKPCNIRVHLAANTDNLSQSLQPEQVWTQAFLCGVADAAGDKSVHVFIQSIYIF